MKLFGSSLGLMEFSAVKTTGNAPSPRRYTFNLFMCVVHTHTHTYMCIYNIYTHNLHWSCTILRNIGCNLRHSALFNLCCSWHGSAVLSDTKFLIHGGYNGSNALSDTFIFDTGERRDSHTPKMKTYWFTLTGQRTSEVFLQWGTVIFFINRPVLLS